MERPTIRGPKRVQTGQKLIDLVMPHLHDFVAAYQVDLVITRPSFSAHLDHIYIVLTRLREAGLTANSDKCDFVPSELQLLGLLVDIESGEIHPLPNAIAAIKKLWPDNILTMSQLKSDLGLINFFKEYIPNCSKLSLPLTAKLKSPCRKK